MKLTIEINVSKDIDLEHAYNSCTDALNFSSNVTQLEYDLIENILSQIQIKQHEHTRP